MTTAYDLPIDLSTKGQHHHHHLAAHHQLDTEHLQQLQLEYFSHKQLSAAFANHPLNRLYAASQHPHYRHQLGQLEQLEIQLGHPLFLIHHHLEHPTNLASSGLNSPTTHLMPHLSQHQHQQQPSQQNKHQQHNHHNHPHLQLAQHLHQQLQLSEAHHLHHLHHHGHHHLSHQHQLGHYQQLQDLSASSSAPSTASLASSSSSSSEYTSSSAASISSVSSTANEHNQANRSEPAASEQQESSSPPAHQLSHNLNLHQVNPDPEENPSPIDLHRSSTSSTLSTISSPSSSSASITSSSSSTNLQSSDKKRINRPLTGKSAYPWSTFHRQTHTRLTVYRSTDRTKIRETRETWNRRQYSNSGYFEENHKAAPMIECQIGDYN